MTVEVVTVWCPRPLHPKWDPIYLQLLGLQRASAARWGAVHTIVTDDPSIDTGAIYDPALPRSLMPAMIAGVLRRLTLPCPMNMVFVDVDCLIARELDSAFDGSFDLGLTRRANSDGVCVNNGAMYVSKEGAKRAIVFFKRALALCGDHWGADQEAISQAAAPVPDVERIERRGDLVMSFLSMRTHNAVPKREGRSHDANPYVVHFKGATKAWAATYFSMFVSDGVAVDP